MDDPLQGALQLINNDQRGGEERSSTSHWGVPQWRKPQSALSCLLHALHSCLHTNVGNESKEITIKKFLEAFHITGLPVR